MGRCMKKVENHCTRCRWRQNRGRPRGLERTWRHHL